MNAGLKGDRFRSWILDILLASGSVFLTWLVVEATFSFFGLRYVPLRLHADLPTDVRVFAQSSKAGVVPHNPIVLLGDSYAQGYGDWLLDANPNRNSPFHSAHIIHELTGRDVVSLGQSGAGSAEGIAALPALTYTRTKAAWHLRLPKPTVAVIYFYEGNDLNNNLVFLQKHTSSIPEDLSDARVSSSIAAYPAHLEEFSESNSRFPFLRFLSRISARSYSEWRGFIKSPTVDRVDASRNNRPSGRPTVVEVAGKEITIPADLQSPALELTHFELKQAVLVFERSIAFLKTLFPEAQVFVAYIPSPLSSYHLISSEISVQSYMNERPASFSKEQLMASSDHICDLIRATSIQQGVGFLDLRPMIRAASEQEFVHGPRDFKHFNRVGMTILGRAVARQIDRPLESGPCLGR